MAIEDEEFERFRHEQKFRLDSTFTAAVAQDYYWMPIDDQTPQGVKVLLLGRSGVATMGHYIYRTGETKSLNESCTSRRGNAHERQAHCQSKAGG